MKTHPILIHFHKQTLRPTLRKRCGSSKTAPSKAFPQLLLALPAPALALPQLPIQQLQLVLEELNLLRLRFRTLRGLTI